MQKSHSVTLHAFQPALVSPFLLQGIARTVGLHHVYVVLTGVLC